MWGRPGGGVFGDTNAARGAAQSNLGAIGDITQLTQMINQINANAQRAANAGRIPGGAGLEGISSGNIGTALRGEVDPSVIQQLAQSAAERGIMSGSPGGPSSTAGYLRALGLNALDLMNTGQNWLTAAQGRNPAAPLFNPASMLLSPELFSSIQRSRTRGANVGSSVGGFPVTPSASLAPANLGAEINWADLFGGDNRGLTYASETDTFPYGIGTGTDTTPIIMGEDFAGESTIYNPETDFNFGSSYGGNGVFGSFGL